jgi:hypothetical protein
VTRLGEFSSIGRSVYFGPFGKFYIRSSIIFGASFFLGKSYLFWRKKGLAKFWVIFFTDASGHPAPSGPGKQHVNNKKRNASQHFFLETKKMCDGRRNCQILKSKNPGKSEESYIHTF